ncbi:MAG: hypothetical protein ACE5H2_06780 [Terriglobia bacterium]
MSRPIYLLLAVFCLLLNLLVSTAQQPEAPIFTYVVERNVPGSLSGEVTAFGEQQARPVLERQLAEGTIVSWGEFASVVHVENGTTHGTWWAATGIAAIERVRAGLLKLPPGTEAVGITHHDHLFRSLIHRAQPVGPTSGYLWVAAVLAQPGKGQEYRERWEKYVKPTYDELLGNGTILMYEFSVEHVHTENPNWHYTMYITPTADAQDKVSAAIAALFETRAPEDEHTIGDAIAEVSVRGEHRDFFARLLNYAHK